MTTEDKLKAIIEAQVKGGYNKYEKCLCMCENPDTEGIDDFIDRSYKWYISTDYGRIANLVHNTFPECSDSDIAKVFTMGAEKYDEDNWRKGMNWRKCLASLMRHTNAFNRGEDLDPESGLPHMAHVAVNAMFLLEYMRTNKELDDRFRTES